MIPDVEVLCKKIKNSAFFSIFAVFLIMPNKISQRLIPWDIHKTISDSPHGPDIFIHIIYEALRASAGISHLPLLQVPLNG